MPTNQQRREAERRRLQRQLEERRAREAARKRTTLIASIVGTLVVIAGVIVAVVLTTGGSSGNNGSNQNAAGQQTTPSAPTSTAPTTPASTPPAAPAPTTPCATAPKSPKHDTVSFKGVTVSHATDLHHAPVTKSLSERAPTQLECMDIVTGKGKAASPTSTVSVQYDGVLYKDGTHFDSSWSRGGKPVSFPLTQVVPGFTQGIGGAGKVAPMKVGGRRIMILPASLGYGSSANGSIPANSPLVFVVDLTKTS